MSIFRFIKWIEEGVPIEMFGDGSQSRDFTYVDDIARVLLPLFRMSDTKSLIWVAGEILFP